MEQMNYRKPNRMATASLVLGVLSILSVLTIQFIQYSFLFGCLGALFAHLSKGSGSRMSERAVGGMATSLFAIALTILIAAAGTYLAIRLFGLETLLDPEALQDALTQFYDQYFNSLTAGGASL